MASHWRLRASLSLWLAASIGNVILTRAEIFNVTRLPSLQEACGLTSSALLENIDGPGCFLPPQSFIKPTDMASWKFEYDSTKGINVRFFLRVQKGSAQLMVQTATGSLVLSDDSGPGGEVALALSDHLEGWEDVADEKLWIVSVLNNDVVTRWTLQIDVTDDSIALNLPSRKVLRELYSECCDPSAASTLDNDPCQQLLDWSMEPPVSGKPQKLSLNTDACRYPFNLCDSDGNLRALVLDGSNKYDHLAYGNTAVFSNCTKPPSALSKLTSLEMLELAQLGVAWDLADTLQALKPLRRLKRLHLPLNNIQGSLAGVKVCDFFNTGPALVSLSLSNVPELNGQEISVPSFSINQINGTVDNCIFNSSLQYLNLDYTQVEKVPQMVVNNNLLSLSMKGGSSRGGGMVDEYETLPDTLYYATKLEYLDVSGRMISGSLVNLPKSLVTVDLSRNNFSGLLPNLSTFPNLVSFVATGSRLLTGDIVESVAKADSLERLDLSDTAVTGDLGLSRWALPNLKYLSLAMTDVYGDLGKCLWDMPQLETLILSSVNVGGQLNKYAWMLPKLKNLVMHHTNIEGFIPAFLGRLPELVTLDLSSNPKIISQASFAGALKPGNKINVYQVSNCSIRDLPDELMSLGVFTRDCSMNLGRDFPISKEELKAEWRKAFDITGNEIENYQLPAWLLGPYPSTCFTPAAFVAYPEGVNFPGQLQLEVQMVKPEVGFDSENAIQCGALVPNKETLDFMSQHIQMGPAWNCLDENGTAVNITEAMWHNYEVAMRQTQGPTTLESAKTPKAVLPPRMSEDTTRSAGMDQGDARPSSSSSLTGVKLAAVIVGSVAGGSILIGLFAVFAVRAHRHSHMPGKGKLSVPLATLDSMAANDEVVIVPLPAEPVGAVAKAGMEV